MARWRQVARMPLQPSPASLRASSLRAAARHHALLAYGARERGDMVALTTSTLLTPPHLHTPLSSATPPGQVALLTSPMEEYRGVEGPFHSWPSSLLEDLIQVPRW